jgi:Glycosyl transferase family 11
VKLYGGLGNQMFEYATGRRLAIANHDLLKLDVTSFKTDPLRNYCLNHFNIFEQIATDEEIFYLKNIGYFKEEPYLRFYPDVLKLGRDVYLEGNWPSEKYFADIEGIIKQEFTVKHPLTGDNKRLAESINYYQSVALHIRRGDYLAPMNNGFFVICPLSYYYEAANRLAGQLANIHFFVFSDDPDWVQENFQLPFPTTFIRHNGQDQNYEDLRLMTFCKHHIIANSTFSWWGAWLASKPAKIVFAPAQWINYPDYSTYNLYPKSWNVI